MWLTASDKIHQKICEKLNVGPDVLSLAQVLEAATWKGGREIAKEKRAGGGRKCLMSFSDCANDQRQSTSSVTVLCSNEYIGYGFASWAA